VRRSKSLMGITPADVAVPGTAPGTPMGGGFYGGRIKIGANTYDLIVSSRAEGDFSDWFYTYWDFDVEFNTSLNDGMSIQQAAAPELYAYMIFSQLSSVSWGGFTDWYLGSKEEMEVIYRNLKPGTANNVTNSGVNNSTIPVTGNYSTTSPAQTSAVDFRTGGSQAFYEQPYYTSSRGPSGKLYCQTKSFVNGADGEIFVTDRTYTRAIRRILVAA